MFDYVPEMGQCKTCLYANKKGSKYLCIKPKPNPLWGYEFSGEFGCINHEMKKNKKGTN